MSECTPNQISPDVLQNARTLADLYSQLGVYSQGTPPPNQVNPADEDLGGRYAAPQATDDNPTPFYSFSRYMTSDGSGFDVGILFADNSAMLNCLTTQLNYNSEEGQTTWQEVGRIRGEGGEDAVRAYLDGLDASHHRNYEIYDAINIINVFRTNPGNNFSFDNNSDVISRDDFVALVTRAYNDRPTRQAKGEKLIRYLHSFIGLAVFLNESQGRVLPSRVDAPAVTLNADTTSVNIPLPTGETAWPEGATLSINNTSPNGVTLGSSAVTLEADRFAIGPNTVEVKVGETVIYSQSVTREEAVCQPVDLAVVNQYIADHPNSSFMLPNGFGATSNATAKTLTISIGNGESIVLYASDAPVPEGNPNRNPVHRNAQGSEVQLTPEDGWSPDLASGLIGAAGVAVVATVIALARGRGGNSGGTTTPTPNPDAPAPVRGQPPATEPAGNPPVEEEDRADRADRAEGQDDPAPVRGGGAGGEFEARMAAQERFEQLVMDRHEVLANTQYEDHVEAIAERAVERWTAEGRPLIENGTWAGFPDARFVEEAVDHVLREQVEDAEKRQRMAERRGRSTERITEENRDAMREVFRRAHELSRRAGR